MSDPVRRAPRTLHCPQCRTVIAWNPDNPWRPFCSERCKLIDLGHWASGDYRIPQVESDTGRPDDAGD